MPWYVYLAHLFSGVFLVNGVPHFINGISGNRFQTPFASPPTIGTSLLINVFWEIVNFIVGILLLTGIRRFELGINVDTLAFVIGIVSKKVMASNQENTVKTTYFEQSTTVAVSFSKNYRAQF